jgi:hypothetical protein
MMAQNAYDKIRSKRYNLSKDQTALLELLTGLARILRCGLPVKDRKARLPTVAKADRAELS